MTNSDIERKQQDYVLLLLEGKIEDAQALKMELEAQDQTISLTEAETWANECRALAEKARQIAQNGVKPGSLPHTHLQDESRVLGDYAYQYVNAVFMNAYKSFLKDKEDQKPSGITLQQLLRDLQRYASRDVEDGKEKTRQIFNEIIAKFPNAREEAEKRKRLGRQLRDFINKAYRYGTQGKETDFESLKAELKSICELASMAAQLDMGYQRGIAAAERGKAFAKMRKEQKKPDKVKNDTSVKSQPANLAVPRSLTTMPNSPDSVMASGVYVGHGNCLTDLKPSSSWTVLMDETGNRFGSSSPSAEGKLGKYVALLVPKDVKLPDLEVKWHAVDSDVESIVANAEVLYGNPCGIIGIPSSGLHDMTCENWFACMETVLGLILRLLPVDGPTKFNLFVEQRGDYNQSANDFLNMTCKKALYDLSKVFPDRSSKITIESQFISKEGHPWNGYVDTVAYLWGSDNGKDILKQKGWLGTCLLEAAPAKLQHALDAWNTQRAFEPMEWNDLLQLDKGDRSSAFIHALLDAVGREAIENQALWTSYLQYTKRHLDSKTVNLRELKSQIRWLKSYRPMELELTPRLHLLWLTAELAEANHTGKVFEGALDEFMELGNSLIDEDAPLVAWSRLHLAVAFTNEYDFDSAHELLKEWATVSKAIPGLQYYGQILSSLGQHLAFTGRSDEAIQYFSRAIQCFGKLSDEDEAARDIQQTGAYRLIAMLDAGLAGTEDFNAELERYFDLPLHIAALEFSASDEQPYSHHILLRTLATGKYAEATAAYLKGANDWKVRAGHPWELIQFYRALIVEQEDERARLLRNAHDIALAEGGPTLDAIACVMLGSLYFYDHSVHDELARLVDKVKAELPRLGEQRVLALENQLVSPIAPMELAKIVLPFNFK